MTPHEQMALTGVFRPRPQGPGFGIPVFIAADQFHIQQTSADGVTVGFLPCDICIESIRPVGRQSDHTVGQAATFAFEAADGTMVVDSKDGLTKWLLIHADQLYSTPFVLNDVADFLNDAALKTTAQQLILSLQSASRDTSISSRRTERYYAVDNATRDRVTGNRAISGRRALAGAALVAAPMSTTAPSRKAHVLLAECFSPNLLPNRRTHPRFRPEEVVGNLYINLRTWVDATPFDFDIGSDEGRHEHFLDVLFWGDGEPASQKCICLLGGVGIGKSTLLDYYLRCYGPHNGFKSASFATLTTLTVDFAHMPDSVTCLSSLYYSLQEQIHDQCNRISFDITSRVQRRNKAARNIHEYVVSALEELSEAARSDTTSPFTHLVFVADNLDQCSFDVQWRVINELQLLLENKQIRLWRVVLPLWPSTFDQLRSSMLGIFTNPRVLRLGNIAMELLLHRRAVHASKMARVSIELQEFVDEMAQLALRAYDVLSPLTNSDCRRTMRALQGFVCGEAAAKLVSLGGGIVRLSSYQVLDALLVGEYDYMRVDDWIFPNIFALGRTTDEQCDVFIGFCVLYLLYKGMRSRRAVYAQMGRFGYGERDIDAVFNSLRLFNVYHETALRDSPDLLQDEFEIHEDVVNGILGLIREPAYIDNVAMITPIDGEYRSRMHRTTGSPREFERRVSSTIVFLEFLWAEEKGAVASLTGVSQDRRVDQFEAISGIRWLLRMITNEYWNRLATLRHSTLESNALAGWVDSQLGADVFRYALQVGRVENDSR